MRHKLCRQFRADQRDVILLEVELPTEIIEEILNKAEGVEVGIMRSEDNLKRFLFETENNSPKSYNHKDNSEEHLAQNLKMPSESKQTGVAFLRKDLRAIFPYIILHYRGKSFPAVQFRDLGLHQALVAFRRRVAEFPPLPYGSFQPR